MWSRGQQAWHAWSRNSGKWAPAFSWRPLRRLGTPAGIVGVCFL